VSAGKLLSTFRMSIVLPSSVSSSPRRQTAWPWRQGHYASPKYWQPCTSWPWVFDTVVRTSYLAGNNCPKQTRNTALTVGTVSALQVEK